MPSFPYIPYTPFPPQPFPPVSPHRKPYTKPTSPPQHAPPSEAHTHAPFSKFHNPRKTYRDSHNSTAQTYTSSRTRTPSRGVSGNNRCTGLGRVGMRRACVSCVGGLTATNHSPTIYSHCTDKLRYPNCSIVPQRTPTGLRHEASPGCKAATVGTTIA